MSLTPEQLERRKHGIGASEIAAIAGINPWKAPIDVWLDKTGKTERQPENKKMALGHWMEPVICGLYAEDQGCELVECPTVQHPDHPWALATPDRKRLDRERLVEAKNVGARLTYHWAQGELPDYVMSQLQWQQWVTGIHEADAAAMLGGGDFVIRPGNFIPEVAETLAQIGEEFWFDHVQADMPPPIDASDGWKKYVSSVWPKDLAPMGQATGAANDYATTIRYAKAVIEEEKLKLTEAETALKDLIGDKAGLVSDEWVATWKLSKSGGVDWKAVAMSLGAGADEAVVEAHKRPGSRRFYFKEIK